MLLGVGPATKIYLAVTAVDLRKGFNRALRLCLGVEAVDMRKGFDGSG